MNKVLQKFNLKRPLNSLMPWKKLILHDNLEFRNLDHFIHTVSKLTQKEDDKCEITYKKALYNLKNKVSTISSTENESIRNLVRSNLQKRGLITAEVYEQFKYTDNGTCVGIDVGKYAAGEPDCIITPTRQYVDYFYELFISISYSYLVSNSDVKNNTAKLLSTIKELERQHIFIKITLVLPINSPSGKGNFFSSIPLFHHKEPKSVEIMSSVLNEYLLRKFYFALLEGIYEETLLSSYGTVMTLNKSMNIGNTFNEISFFKEIKKEVGVL